MFRAAVTPSSAKPELHVMVFVSFLRVFERMSGCMAFVCLVIVCFSLLQHSCIVLCSEIVLHASVDVVLGNINMCKLWRLELPFWGGGVNLRVV